ncbi:MAG: protein kinase [Deltaproteobacteria bacterium]|nr:protein kinase [Deltaproteobacteria bacterium]
MGSVWVAEHLKLERPVAVKFVSAEVPRQHLPALLARFDREAKAAAKLRSRHVVTIHDYGVLADEQPFLVMELLAGESLGDRLARERTLGLKETAVVLRQVCSALGAAHAQGIVHRDIKPDNIFLASSDEEEEQGLFVKVLDFGIAKIAEPPGAERGLTATGVMMGTPNYMSPEQMQDVKLVGPASDLWAVGAVAYHALVGEVPFRGDTAVALWLSKKQGPPRPVSERCPGAGEALDGWFDCALCPDPKGRFPSAKEMSSAFVQAARKCGVRISLDPIDSAEQERARGEPSARRPPRGSVRWTQAEWLVRSGPGSEPVGPVSLDSIHRGIETGELPPDAQACRQGSADWQLASLVLVEQARQRSEPPPRPEQSPVHTVPRAPAGAPQAPPPAAVPAQTEPGWPPPEMRDPPRRPRRPLASRSACPRSRSP